MPHSRRQFFTQIARSLADGVASVVTPKQPEHNATNTQTQAAKLAWIRPPGALAEQAFLSTCTRCTDCLEACPYDAIRRLGPEYTHASGSPVIIFEDTPCYLCKDTPCIQVCEVDALIAKPRDQFRMAKVSINLDQCYLQQNQPCDYCLDRCPLKPDAIKLNDQNLPEISIDQCAGCGVCAYICPPQAITMTAY